MSIAEAIATKRLLRFTYGGYTREVEPHTYGIDKNTHHALVAYQIRGGSHSGEYVGWKTIHESEMRALSILKQTFAAPRHGYRRNDPAFASIIAQL
ncbi:MAG: hypothetical protein H0T80_05935 [Betaproteobacteria bacterium]|nr:hypothetical protein [Betaproteobacteria bacterium]MBA3776362.1 hypothetical protein [Betaproteobacteria bacterium]